MKPNSLKKSAVLAIILSASLSMPAISAPVVSPPGPAIHSGIDEFSSINRGGGRAGGGHAGPGRAGPAHVGGGGRANVNVNRRANVNVNRHTNVNVNVRRGGVAVAGRGPVRRWVRRPYYGRIVGGLALGTVIGVAVVGTAPV